MAKRGRPSFRLSSELTEKQIEADVATFFGWITPPGPNAPFHLIDVNEGLTGADKRFDSIIPIYLQFKVSVGLKPWTGGYASSPFDLIREYRKTECLYDNPTLYFRLRDMAPTADDFQHNKLMSIAYGQPKAYAFYVAPLFLEYSKYNAMLFDSNNRILLDPFYYNLCYRIMDRRSTSIFGHIPFLRGHISIVPSEYVTTSEHYYSYSPTGTDIAWHSPETIDSGASRLSDQLMKIFASFRNPEDWWRPEEYANEIAQKQLNPEQSKGDAFESISSFAKSLRKQFGIRTFLLATSSDYLSHSKNLN